MEKPDVPFAYSTALKPLRDHDLRWDAGQWYWGPTASFLQGIPLDSDNVIKVIIPDERVCDINVIEDWEMAEHKYRRLQLERDALTSAIKGIGIR